MVQRKMRQKNGAGITEQGKMAGENGAGESVKKKKILEQEKNATGIKMAEEGTWCRGRSGQGKC